MNAIKHHKRIVVMVVAILLLFIDFILLFCISSPSVYAEISGTSYSNVIDDLKSDADFNISLYPANEKDYSLQVIQVAESEDGELLVYVYQPSNGTKDYTATSINISTAINDSLYYKNYELELLSRDGVFCKYRVKDFTVKEDMLRYYDISSIFRLYDKDVDEGLPEYNENDINEVSYEVGKLYTAITLNGNVTYSCLDTETIVIQNKYVGYLRYSNGFKLYQDKCDSWFVAFSTDKPIDRLMEADVDYMIQDYTWFTDPNQGYQKFESHGELTKKSVTLNYTDVAGSTADGWFAHEYTWNRIESVDDFVANEDLTEEAKKDLSNMDWVLRFTETNYTYRSDSSGEYCTMSNVSEVSILRLKFETDGVIYNLGVVDNKQSPAEGQAPDNNNTDELDWPSFGDMGFIDIISTIILLVLIVLFVILLAPVLPYIIKMVIWLITLPFKLIGVVIKGIANVIKNTRKRRNK